MNKTLYVGNLPYQANEEDLSTHFSEVGAVASARVVTDRETGRSKGFGFVEMSSEDDAASALDRLNGSELGGRNIRVSEARSNDRPGGGGPRGGGAPRRKGGNDFRGNRY